MTFSDELSIADGAVDLLEFLQRSLYLSGLNPNGGEVLRCLAIAEIEARRWRLQCADSLGLIDLKAIADAQDKPNFS